MAIHQDLLSQKTAHTLLLKYSDFSDFIDDVSNIHTETHSKSFSEFTQELRCNIDLSVIETAESFLEECVKAEASVDSVESKLFSLQQKCSNLSQKLRIVDDNMKQLMDVVLVTKTESAKLISEAETMEKFLQSHQLTEDEGISLLVSNISDQSLRFFTILSRVRQARLECRQLALSSNPSSQQDYTCCLSLLDSLSPLEESAYSRLFEWARKEIESQVASTVLPVALSNLQHRPQLYNYCCDAIISIRRSSIVSRFVACLTSGSDESLSSSSSSSSFFSRSSSKRPLDMMSHDTVRYFGMIFAWIHQSVASEIDFFLATFGTENGNKSESKPVKLMISDVIDGLVRPFQVRFDGISSKSHDSICLWISLLDLFSYYSTTLFRSLSIDLNEISNHKSLLSVLVDDRKLVQSNLLNDLQNRINVLTRTALFVPIDQSSSFAVMEVVQLCKEVVKLSSYRLMEQQTENDDDDDEDNNIDSVISKSMNNLKSETCPHTSTILTLLLLPVIARCKHATSSSSSSHHFALHQSIFMINCISDIFQLEQPSSKWARVLQVENASQVTICTRELMNELALTKRHSVLIKNVITIWESWFGVQWESDWSIFDSRLVLTSSSSSSFSFDAELMELVLQQLHKLLFSDYDRLSQQGQGEWISSITSGLESIENIRTQTTTTRAEIQLSIVKKLVYMYAFASDVWRMSSASVSLPGWFHSSDEILLLFDF